MRSPYRKPLATGSPEERIVSIYREIPILRHYLHGQWIFSFLAPSGEPESQTSLEFCKSRIDHLLQEEESLAVLEEHF